MKCIHCGNDSIYRVRSSNGGKCGSCGHHFAFEPKTDPLKLTDGLFQKIVKDVSGDGTLFYTEKQLWYEFNRRAAKNRPLSCGASVILWMLLIPVSQAVSRHHLYLLGAVAVVSLMAVKVSTGRKQSKPVYVPVSLATFQGTYLTKWVHIHGALDHLLDPPNRAASQRPPAVAEELSAFSFDRVLITEHADIAAMLVANNFHFENNCAILSLDGYPHDRFDTVFRMLANNPQLMVFALHDATLVGNEMGAALRDTRWFPNPSIRIIDLGLRPQHAIKANMILLKTTVDPTRSPVRSSLTADEIAWLVAGNMAEVANVRPAKLMRSIYQGFARASQVGMGGADVYDDSGMMIWVYDPRADYYAIDTFG